jgi:hypothetical protein
MRCQLPHYIASYYGYLYCVEHPLFCLSDKQGNIRDKQRLGVFHVINDGLLKLRKVHNLAHGAPTRFSPDRRPGTAHHNALGLGVIVDRIGRVSHFLWLLILVLFHDLSPE